MSNEHIVRSFAHELERLSNLITQMGGVAEAQVDAAVKAVARRDVALAAQVMQADQRIDAYERDIDAEAVRLLALRQPLAQDLREIVSALKIASDLERIGDYASNIAKRSLALAQVPVVRPAVAIPRMGRLVESIMKDVLDAYIERDVQRAIAAWERDEELDDLYTSLFREVLTYMMEDPRNITPCTHLLFMAKNLERIGDHATNIAETIHYLVVGTPLRAARPKSDGSSFAVVEPEGLSTESAERGLPRDGGPDNDGAGHAA
ncbi:PhoU-like phosphate uptake regulator [Azospirillum brasilense]|uniref:Phosphate-specific transport system accessory protein PhoU homolog n=1 Tax=Azospirillum brasilense TaxID=192 RepID=A0A560CHS3_AZOBR|nr:phosphate signaling complex protein PhoU [Azospirillum brasilense]MBK3733954.1 phosphate signaling complex protein PhoU [Azospirillum brasilense]TWA84413.1 PhoU-like phosphate uptake regulator [Azospirillum brasilense]